MFASATGMHRPLRANLGDHYAFAPIKSGALTAPGVAFDFCGPTSPPSGFKDMVRTGAYDVGELALGTYLQAFTYGKPIILLPVTITARLQHHMIVCRDSARFAPVDAAGKRIGVRSYTQTTGIWVRGILSESYGVDLNAVTWVTAEGAHLAEYTDPPNVERVATGDQIAEMLFAGKLDAAIFGADMPRDRTDLVPLIPDPHATALQWYAERGYMPINHMLAVTRDLVERELDMVRGIYRLFAEAKALAPMGEDGIDFLPLGFDAVRPSVEAMVDHAVEQNIIPQRLGFDELFEDARRLLDS